MTYLILNKQSLINELISNKAFTLPISLNLINAINNVLKGIHKEQIEIEHLMKALGDGNPITVDEAKRNFDTLLKRIIGAKDTSRIRLTIKK